MAEVLAEEGVSGSFYALPRKDAFGPAVLRRIEALGHEVGLHYECLDRCVGDFAGARDLFAAEVEFFRSNGLRIATACAHSELLLMKDGYTLNGELMAAYPTLMEECDIVGEAELLARPHRLIHMSDRITQMRFLLQTALEAPMSRGVHVLLHPHRWARAPGVGFGEIVRDLTQGCRNLVKGRRAYLAVVAMDTLPRVP